MKKISLLFALLAVTFASAQTVWNFDKAHSSVHFSVKHMVISEVEGQFTKFDGDIKTTKDDFSDAKINFTVAINSVSTDNEKRDNHLKGADFFDVAKYPTMTFVSTAVEKVSDGIYNLKGNLTLHGVTKPITLKMTYGGTIKDPWGNTRAGLKVSGTINRVDFGLKYNSTMEAGGLLIGEDVNISCKVELIKK
ncbi:MAG: YceI family protein [Lutibacter sp.]|jgi:polyisoprenoid-binding protein YceI|uniref:YceI family protein n=1 Tax=Lutibacter sp. TaxID=1925666 RepID=UPI00299D50B5|nr:YceI family protein [Lutibacter sp.]MDX1828356.1 YceI family protein [Lutibacter sp.]